MTPLILTLTMTAAASTAGNAPLTESDRAGLFIKAVEEARTARTKEELEQAIERYQQIAASWPPGTGNGYLEYNLGNAYFRLDDLGRAILHWRRAERFLPGDLQLAHNLTYGRSRVPGSFDTAGAKKVASVVFFWHAWAMQTRYWLALGAFALFWGFLGVRLFVQRRLYTAIAILCLLVALGLGVSTFISYRHETIYPAAVIVAHQITVYQGNYEDSGPLFTDKVPGGTEIRVIEERGDWVRIEFPNGRDGWIKRLDTDADPRGRPTFERI